MTTNEPRPREYTPEMRAAAAREVARYIVGKQAPDEDAAALADAIVEAGRYDRDGFQLAKTLEGDGWDVDSQWVEYLDAYGARCDDELRREVKAWVKRNDITPTLPHGARVKLRSGETGAVDRTWSHCESEARYAITLDGDLDAGPLPEGKLSRRLVPFESVEALAIAEESR